MTEVLALSPATSLGTAARSNPTQQPPAGDDASASSVIAADFETFLSLLTAQMRNQDPLKPVESTEFVAQLASFSSVEQQIRSNKQLEAIFDVLTRGQGAGLAEWIGRDVRTSAPLRYDAGAGVDVAVEPIAGATRAFLVARDAGGVEVGRIPVDPAATSVRWTGRTEEGVDPGGLRRFEVEYRSDEALLRTVPGELFATVAEVQLGASPKLLVSGGVTLDPDEVQGLRASPLAEG